MTGDANENVYEYQRSHQLRRFTYQGPLGNSGDASVCATAIATGLRSTANDTSSVRGSHRHSVEPFYGAHQGGITTTPQRHTYFASLKLDTKMKSDIVDLLRAWTAAAANLALGQTAAAITTKLGEAEVHHDEAADIGTERLTVNFGFGPSLFAANRFGLVSRRPPALVDLPRFPGDQLVATKVGGDLTIHACAEDSRVASGAVRQLVRLARGIASIVWTQAGFIEVSADGAASRLRTGFGSGISSSSEDQLNEFVWVGSEEPEWMRGGTYLVARRIRISLEHWDSESLDTRGQITGGRKASGESSGLDCPNAGARETQDDPVIPVGSHVRLSAPAANHGRRILRRSYAYDDGVDPLSECEAPPQGVPAFDVGLLFCAYQRDPRTGFIPIFQNLTENDSLGQSTTHTGSAIVAIPPGAPAPGHFVGEELFA